MGGAICALLLLGTPAAGAVSPPAPGFYAGGPKTGGVSQVGMNVYRFNGKTLVTAATRVANEKFVCRPSGDKGRAGVSATRIKLSGMALKANGSFSSGIKFVATEYTISGKFVGPNKVDIRFSIIGSPGHGPPNELCDAKQRLVLTIKRQATTKGLPL
jgi:hypothetical protein